MKSHEMKIFDDVSACPSLNMTVKSVYNILLRSVKTCPTSQKSTEPFSTITALGKCHFLRGGGGAFEIFQVL